MMDLQETIEAYKRSELNQNDTSLKKEHESIPKSPIFLKKVPLNSIYTKTLQNDSSIKAGSNSLNDDNFKQRTLPFSLSGIVKKHNYLNSLSNYEDISKQEDLMYNKTILKEKNSKKIPENNFEVCIHEKTPSKFLNFTNHLHNSPLLQGNVAMESQLSISKNPWRNKLSGFSPPTKRKNMAIESSENGDSIVFTGTENSLVDSTDIFSNTKKQKILQPNFNQLNIPLANIGNISKDSSKFNQKKINVSDQNNGGVGLLFSGLEKNAELLHTNSQLLSIKQKTKDVKSKFFGFQKFLDGLGRDHNSLHKEIIKWSNEIKSFQTDIIKSRESLQGIIHQCEVLTRQGKLNSKVHKQLGEVKEELVKQNMYRKSLQEKNFKDATLLAEERDKVRFLENQLISERKEKDNQYNKFLKEHEFFERLLQNFYEETQKNENTLKNIFTRWSDEVKTMEHNILHEISLNFHAGSNIFDPFLKEIREKWQKYSKESLSIYSDIKNFHSNILSSNNKRIEDLENNIKQANIIIKEKEEYESVKKTDDFVQLAKSFQLEIEGLKIHLEKFKTDFEKPFHLNNNNNNENYLDKFQNIKEISEKLKITEKNHEQLSNENIKLQNIIKDMKQELKVSKDECDSLKSKMINLENSNSLFMDLSNNNELKKQYEKEIADYERRVLKLKETEQAKFDNIIKSKDNKINKLEKEILLLKSLNNDKNNIDDKLSYKEKLICMVGLEKAELIEKIADQDNTINSLKFEITKLLKNNFSDDINKDSQKIRISHSSNRIIHQTPGKSNNPSKININTPIHLVSQIISPPSENKIKRVHSSSLEYVNNENKINSRLTKNIENCLRDETVAGNLESLNDDLVSAFIEVPKKLLNSPSQEDHSLLEKIDSPLVFFDNTANTQHKSLGSAQLVSQSLVSSGKDNKKSIINNNNVYKNYKDENIETITPEHLSLDANSSKNIENGLRKKNQDKQKISKKAQNEYSNNDTNFWLTAQLGNSTDQKSYSTRSITNTYKKKKNGKYL
ncbi:uncharacterized protein T551_01180 [Pneumocystis jirovecii RU7]|uniref:Uncharacterized protein n=1 Tax=Pneumocystis jirovecii (strain RU7) TaxID=1408657 RepID=A0A0W4ZU49_PNEJ7|nr:uncharacterized protein T551_01180 [Pneumocystis jirovecii RU7]KTW31919.1 hypothetical protein T551_01180 [Pneumocystis jirovecii RU7]